MMAYSLEGSILEVCNCDVLCPCWIGEDPDNGTCDAVIGYHFDKGSINGTDVTGRSLIILGFVPGNILQGNWKVALVVDDKASEEQQQALVDVWTGKLGGPVADFSQLIGELVAVERAPVTYELSEGKGTLKVGSYVEAEMEPYRGPTGAVTTLNESIFTTIPGAPAWVAKASTYKRNSSQFGLKDMNLQGKNAIQGSFRFEG
jgi:hypothetical protein